MSQIFFSFLFSGTYVKDDEICTLCPPGTYAPTAATSAGCSVCSKGFSTSGERKTVRTSPTTVLSHPTRLLSPSPSPLSLRRLRGAAAINSRRGGGRRNVCAVRRGLLQRGLRSQLHRVRPGLLQRQRRRRLHRLPRRQLQRLERPRRLLRLLGGNVFRREIDFLRALREKVNTHYFLLGCLLCSVVLLLRHIFGTVFVCN